MSVERGWRLRHPRLRGRTSRRPPHHVPPSRRPLPAPSPGACSPAPAAGCSSAGPGTPWLPSPCRTLRLRPETAGPGARRGWTRRQGSAARGVRLSQGLAFVGGGALSSPRGPRQTATPAEAEAGALAAQTPALPGATEHSADRSGPPGGRCCSRDPSQEGSGAAGLRGPSSHCRAPTPTRRHRQLPPPTVALRPEGQVGRRPAASPRRGTSCWGPPR